MLINEQTKIAALLKHHPDALETIVSLSPDFKKLRNPLLRKLMAARTSISMAAKVGGVKPEDFFKALAPLGFEVDSRGVLPKEPGPQKSEMPGFVKSLPPDKIIPFDVRALLAGGNDPLRQIQQKVKKLKQGEALKIINTFEPVPLIKLLEKQGYQAYVNQINNNLVETWFYKSSDSPAPALEADTKTAGDWDEVMQHFVGNLQEIDVRHLEMPMPMMTILEKLETLPSGQALYVHHKRIPVFLLTELKDRHFEYRIKEVQEGEVYLLIFKAA